MRYAVLRDEDHGNAVPISVVDRVLRTALLAVEYSNDTGGTIDHPFVAALEAIMYNNLRKLKRA